MKSKSILFFMAFIYSCGSLACLPMDPAKNPRLVSFGPVFFSSMPTEETITGTVKAELSLDSTGKVIAAKIIELTPNTLNPKPVLKAIYKAKFNVEKKIKNYVHTFEISE